MVALSFFQVVQRQLFGTGLLWGDTFLRYLVLWVGFLGAAIAAAEGKHFAWEAAAHHGGRRGTILKVVANLACAAITACLSAAAWRFFLSGAPGRQDAVLGGGVRRAGLIFVLAIPAGFTLVLLHTMMGGDRRLRFK